MTLILYSIIYFAVSLLWLTAFSRNSRTLSLSKLGITFSLGLLSAPLAGAISYVFLKLFFGNIPRAELDSGTLNAFFFQFLVVGPVEESVKYVFFILFMLSSPSVKKMRDGVILALSIAAGFAALENVLYMLSYGLHATLPRLLLSNAGHMGYALFWGYALTAVLNFGASTQLLVLGVVAAALFHGLYNFLLGTSLAGAIAAFLLTLTILYFLVVYLRKEKA